MTDVNEPGIGQSMASDRVGALPEIAKIAGVRLRLYIARSTPNSVRAEHNLTVALKEMRDEHGKPELEIVDVFAHPKRAITDSVMITPTLIGIGPNGRLTMIGDLAEEPKLKQFLQSLSGNDIRRF